MGNNIKNLSNEMKGENKKIKASPLLKSFLKRKFRKN